MSATPSERRALLFLAGIACLGVGVRAAGAVRREPPRPEQRAALARQLEAVDSARNAGRGRRARGAKRESGAGNRESVPAASRRSRASVGRVVSPPLGPTPDTRLPTPGSPIDVDRATAAQLEALPRVGPALAGRIVADRERLGPFGSLQGLERVRGVGPGLLRILQDRVTFSGTPRLPHDVQRPVEAGRTAPSATTPSSPDQRHRPRPKRRR